MPMRQVMEPLAPGAAFIESPYCYRCPHHLTRQNCDMACARELARILEFEGPDQFSVFIGSRFSRLRRLETARGLLPIIRDICDRYGILLIIDEVICGFGRTGKMFATEHLNVKADMITMAKGLTSGYVPLGAVGCTDQVMEPSRSSTTCTPTGTTRCRAPSGQNIEILKRDRLVENSAAMGPISWTG